MRTLRLKRWAVHVNRSKSCSRTRSNCHGPTLRSSSIQNVKGLDESYVVNLKLLGEGLRRCTKCEGGPFSLDDIIKPPVRVGLVWCYMCSAEIVRQKVRYGRITPTELEGAVQRQ